MAEFPVAAELRRRFEHLRPHAGYSQIPDVHFQDPQFPAAVTCTPSEAELLHTLVRLLRPERPVEVGSYVGWSTAHIATALDGATLQCIEPFLETDADFEPTKCAGAKERFRENMVACGCWNSVVLVESPAPTCFQDVAPERGWDFIFLDGWHNHGQPLRDVDGAVGHMSANAVVVLHDPWVPDVRDAMLRLMQHGLEVHSLDTANYLTVGLHGSAFPAWERFCEAAREPRHCLERARVMRRFLGLCEASVGEACRAFGIPNRYHCASLAAPFDS